MCPCEMGENLKKVPDAAETRAPVGANNMDHKKPGISLYRWRHLGGGKTPIHYMENTLIHSKIKLTQTSNYYH